MVLEYCHLKSPQHSIKQWGSFTEGFSSPNFKQRTFDSENTQRKILQGRGGPNILKEESIFTWKIYCYTLNKYIESRRELHEYFALL